MRGPLARVAGAEGKCQRRGGETPPLRRLAVQRPVAALTESLTLTDLREAGRMGADWRTTPPLPPGPLQGPRRVQTGEPQPMEEEIDLREYVRVLLRWWKWIVGVTVVAAAVATAVSFLQPTSYEATATVAWRRVSTGATDSDASQGKAGAVPDISLSDLALNTDVVEALASQLKPLPEGVRGSADLRGVLRASASTDGSRVQLAARAAQAEEAARLADAWASVVVAKASQAFREDSNQEAETLRARAKSAWDGVAKAEQALAGYEARSQLAVLEARRASVEQDLRDSLAEQRDVARAIQQVRDLRGRLASLPADARVEPADALTALMLQAQMAGVTGGSQPAAHVQLGDAAMASVGQTVGEATAFLDRLVARLTSTNDRLAANIAGLEPQLLTLQQQVQQAEVERDRLTAERDAARQVYTTLAEQAGELEARAAGEQAYVVSPASLPAAPAGRNRLFNVAVAGVLGLMLGVFGAFAIEWWRGGAQDEGKAGPAQG